MRIRIEIAPGELIDRITILEIKLARIDDPEKIKHVKNEYETLVSSYNQMLEWMRGNKLNDKFEELNRYTLQIKEANEKIWVVLQQQRELERANNFGEEFIKISLEVYHVNDERADGKRKINELLNTDIAEVKSYPE